MIFKKFIDGHRKKRNSVSDKNWYIKFATACEGISDAVLWEKKGASYKIAKVAAGKLGVAGTSVGIFSIASLFGSASTGTAIGSLSGAAFNSAALAWLGGSVFMGSIILTVVSTAGGIGTILGASWILKKYVWGKKRNIDELPIKERNIVDVCLSLAMAFRHQENSGKIIDPIIAKAVYEDVLNPLCDNLYKLESETKSWPLMAKRRLKKATAKLLKVTTYFKQYSDKLPNVATGIVSAVFIQLLANELPSFNGNELLVLDALRRSNNKLTGATNEELADYIQSLEPKQLTGLRNNVKGIYHELYVMNKENADGDEYVVEIFNPTNHPGSDISIINEYTGEIKEVQLKATDYLSYIQQHNARYENIEIFATSEVASLDPDIVSTGISNRELNDDVGGVMENLDDCGEIEILNSMTVAAVVSLARNIKVLLRGGNMTSEQKSKLVKDGMISAGVAGIVSLIVG